MLLEHFKVIKTMIKIHLCNISYLAALNIISTVSSNIIIEKIDTNGITNTEARNRHGNDKCAVK